MASLVALTRLPAQRLADRCELTFLERRPIDADRLRAEHRAYREALAAAGARVIALDPIEALPDSAFVEDAAVVLDELAVLARPGVASRRDEPARIDAPLRAHRGRVEALPGPGTLEGGDVLRIGGTLYVGHGARTDRAGIEAFAALVGGFGYRVVPVAVHGSLHLKTACTALDDDTVLINPAWLDAGAFAGFARIEVDDDEPFAANVLPVGDALIANAAFPRTLARVRAHAARTGRRLLAVNLAEFGKAEAGLTCLSLVFAASGDRP